MNDEILSAIAAVCGAADISREELLAHGVSRADVVDARYCLVHLLSSKGYYPNQIARILGVSRRYVSIIQTRYDSRLFGRKYMRNIAERLGSGM